jgi:hypothetical protein
MSDEKRKEQRERKLDELCRLFREGLESGQRIAADEVFGPLERKYAEMVKKGQA